MMGYYGGGTSGWMWVMGTLVMLFFLGGLAVFVVWAVRTFAGPGRGNESADDILQRRLAAGQISQEEYDKTRRTLHT